MNKFIMQIKREFWECRASFIRTPIVMAGVLAALLLLGLVPLQNKISSAIDSGKIQVTDVPELGTFFGEQKVDQLGDAAASYLVHGLAAVYALFVLVLVMVLLFYFADALFSDRRDQSILFWKSLPVAEHRNVLSKLTAGVVGAAVFYGLAAVATGIFFLLVSAVYAGVFWDLPVPGVGAFAKAFFTTTFGLVLGWFALVLWLLPIFCWILFSSAAVKKAPFLIALGVPLGVVVLEFWLLGSGQVFGVLKNQVVAGFYSLYLLTHQPSTIVEHAAAMFATLQFWAGLTISIGILTACVWLRNNRWEV